MVHFLIKRLLSIIPVLLGISLLLFFMLRMLPGDPAQVLAGQMASPEDIQVIRIQLGLDQPLYIQYAAFLKRLVHLDLGVSARTQNPVIQEIWARLPNTILLALCAITLACVLGIPAGVVGPDRIIEPESIMGGEDMAFVFEKTKGCYFFLTAYETRAIIRIIFRRGYHAKKTHCDHRRGSV